MITEARKEGADEGTIKGYMYKYIQKLLSPEKYKEFTTANEEFEEERRRNGWLLVG